MATVGEPSDVGRNTADRRGGLIAAVRDARPVTLLFAAAVALSAALLLGLGSRLTFLLDDWEFLVYRRGFNADAILGPHGENIAVGPVLVYKALLATVRHGLGAAVSDRLGGGVPRQRRRCSSSGCADGWGSGWRLPARSRSSSSAPAWEDLLWAFQVGYFVSMAAGLGALLALERRDQRGDLIACALLVVSILFSSLGLPFLLAAAVAIVLGPRGARLERVFTLVVPAGLFAVWWLGWGHDADTTITAENVATAPIFIIDGVASAISSLLGLATPRDESTVGALDWGRPLLVAAVGLAGWRLWRLRRLDARADRRS